MLPEDVRGGVRIPHHPPSRPRGRGAECLRARQRVTPLPLDREVRELVDPEERCARDVPLEVALPTGLDAREVVAAVDEPVLDQ